MNILKRLLSEDSPQIPQSDEALNALNIDRWRTREKIIDIIIQNRPPEGQFVNDLTNEFGRKILNILRDLEKDGIAESKDDNQLSFAEMGESDDPKIANPQIIQEIRQIRGGRPQRLYRLRKDGIKLTVTEEEKSSNKAIPILQGA